MSLDRVGKWTFGVAGFVALLVIALSFTVANINPVKGQGTINEATAFFVGLQAAATIILAALTASYVRQTGGLLGRSIEDAAERERSRLRAERELRIRDLDETRRLGYMARMRPFTPHVELAASLINALVHHQGVDEEEALANVPAIINGAGPDAEPTRWLLALIAEINAREAQVRASAL